MNLKVWGNCMLHQCCGAASGLAGSGSISACNDEAFGGVVVGPCIFLSMNCNCLDVIEVAIQCHACRSRTNSWIFSVCDMLFADDSRLTCSKNTSEIGMRVWYTAFSWRYILHLLLCPHASHPRRSLFRTRTLIRFPSPSAR